MRSKNSTVIDRESNSLSLTFEFLSLVGFFLVLGYVALELGCQPNEPSDVVSPARVHERSKIDKNSTIDCVTSTTTSTSRNRATLKYPIQTRVNCQTHEVVNQGPWMQVIF
jgi:hypothetical protein